MSNMGYCRFRNTLNDLRACEEHFEDILPEEEHEARLDLYDLCKDIIFSIEREGLEQLKEKEETE